MKRKMFLQAQRGGSVLVLALSAVVILSVMGAALISLGLYSRTLATRTASEIAARCAADAGLTKAIFEMNKKLKIEPWDGSILPQATTETLPGSDATFGYEILCADDVESEPTGTTDYVVQSVGRYSWAERHVVAHLRLKGPFESAICVQGPLELKAGTRVGAYNSKDPSASGLKAPLATQSIVASSIILNSGVIVDGPIIVGVDGDVDTVVKDLGATTGERYATGEEYECPPVAAPELDAKGKISVKGTTLTIGPGDSGEYSEIVLKRDNNPGILEVTGGDVVLHVTGKVDLGEDCEIVINDDASLLLYVDGNINSGNNSGINNKHSPRDFMLYGTGGQQTFELKAKSNLFGAIYAPNADITMKAVGDMYGAVAGKSFRLMSGGNFYYDVDLRDITVRDEGVRFVVSRWQDE